MQAEAYVSVLRWEWDPAPHILELKESCFSWTEQNKKGRLVLMRLGTRQYHIILVLNSLQ